MNGKIIQINPLHFSTSESTWNYNPFLYVDNGKGRGGFELYIYGISQRMSLLITWILK